VDDTCPGLPDQFFIDLQRLCGSLSCVPLDLLAVMANQSGVRADAQHRTSRATGLIQLTPMTLRGLGWATGPDAFRRLTAVEQLPYVQKYFQPFVRHGLGSSGRLYQTLFLPGTLARGSAPDTVVCGSDGPFADAYAANTDLDWHGRGRITVADLTARVDRVRVGIRWESLTARLATLKAV
jgi:hypothetical protein